MSMRKIRANFMNISLLAFGGVRGGSVVSRARARNSCLEERTHSNRELPQAVRGGRRAFKRNPNEIIRGAGAAAAAAAVVVAR